MVSHVAKGRPRHDLKKTPVEGSRDAVGTGGAGTGRMPEFQVYSRPQDLNKLLQRVVSLREPALARSQVAADDIRKPWRGERTEVRAATEVSRWIDLGRVLAKVWVSARDEFGRRVGRVATVAIHLGIDNVAA